MLRLSKKRSLADVLVFASGRTLLREKATCATCGAKFIARGLTREPRYCSESCGVAAWLKQKEEKDRAHHRNPS